MPLVGARTLWADHSLTNSAMVKGERARPVKGGPWGTDSTDCRIATSPTQFNQGLIDDHFLHRTQIREVGLPEGMPQGIYTRRRFSPVCCATDFAATPIGFPKQKSYLTWRGTCSIILGTPAWPTCPSMEPTCKLGPGQYSESANSSEPAAGASLSRQEGLSGPGHTR